MFIPLIWYFIIFMDGNSQPFDELWKMKALQTTHQGTSVE